MPKMLAKTHQDIIHAAGNEQLQFPLFSLLPIEIRLLIWEYSLQRRRYIHIQLQPRRDDPEIRLYHIVICGYQLLSKLFRVNRESRGAALRYYRVHIPCNFTKTEGFTEALHPGTLHLDPEHDIIQVSPLWGVRDAMADFFFRLKTTYDPLRIGIRNLAMDGNDLRGSDLLHIQPSDLDPPVRSALVDLFTELREFYFVSKQTVGRLILGFHHGVFSTGMVFNRSFPILPMSPGIEYWDRDPRPIDEDLKRVLVQPDPRGMIQSWQQVLREFSISPPKINYQFILTSAIHEDITDRKSAEKRLWMEEQMISDPTYKNLPREHGFEDTKTVANPSFGFWVFPLEAIGPNPESNAPIPHESNRILDLTKYWPTIALMRVPE
jgi:2EXR family